MSQIILAKKDFTTYNSSGIGVDSYAIGFNLTGDLVKKDKFGTISLIVGTSTVSSADITDILYADLLDLYNNANMTPGQYRITDKADKGVIVQALSESEVSSNAIGVFLNPDFQGIGNYSGVYSVYGVTCGSTTNYVWYKNCVAFTYTNGGGTMEAGEYINNTNSSVSAIVAYNDGSKMYISYSNVSEWNTGDVCNNIDGDEITLTSDGILQDYYPVGDIVYWFGKHYQVLNDTALAGVSPDSATAGVFGILSKTMSNVGYVVDVCPIVFSLTSGIIWHRSDSLGNSIGINNEYYQWGNGSVGFCSTDSGGYIFNVNMRGGMSAIRVSSSSSLVVSNDNITTIQSCSFDGGGIYTVGFNGLSSGMYGCSIQSSENFVFRSNDTYASMCLNYSGSTFETTINISGLTAIDQRLVGSEDNKYCGRLILTSTNSAETIVEILYGPTKFPYRFYPESGLVVTFDPTSGGFKTIGGISAVVDGTNGDWIEFTYRDGTIYQTGGAIY